MTWLIEDRKGEIHEILEGERVLVIGPSENYSRNWLLEERLPLFGSQFTVPLNAASLSQGNWAVIVWLTGWEFNEQANALKLFVSKLKRVEREIFV